ncbi:uncharacterized protein LOC128726891 [Anopheles nili]|uniref:uncharacterized protein LOC128726891 n=1 Tax=Anopheles nili TaxID=185578 RepID=UPI00237AA897|nr:uncharacterized protein LOC128726891 [Anopheles nili]
MLPRRRKDAPTLGATSILLIAIGLVGKLCTTNAAASPVPSRRSSLSPAQLYFDAVAPEDRENFIKYHLDRGLEQRLPHYTSSTPKEFEFSTFQDALEPADFSAHLLDHFMIAFGLTEVDVFEFVTLNVICFPSGWCFNPDDIGNICCPF